MVNAEAIERLASSPTASQSTSQRNKRLQYGAWAVAGFGTMGVLALNAIEGEGSVSPVLTMIVIFSIVVAMALSGKKKTSVPKISHEYDPRIVGTYAEVLEWHNKKAVTWAESKLLDWLPHLQASDALLLTTEQKANLNRHLLKADSALAQVILHAYEQIGDSTAIPFVERLARGEGKAGTDPRVVAAANVCLPFLIERAKHTEQEQTLLRAANGNATAPETLLRPANATLETQPETLLRPTQL